MLKRQLLKSAVVGAVAFASTSMISTITNAQEVTLRLHQFLPPVAVVPSKILKPWGEALNKASDGRIVIEHFDAMSLGGRPPALMDQARDGVVDMTMTVVGYTPGRFPRTEVFELPFMMTNPIATSAAFWDYVESDLQATEYKDVKVLGAWVHGPGLIHSSDPISSLEDMKGKVLRGPTRVITDMLSELGAEPVGMPLPAIPESLSKGVIDSTVIPWEVTPSIRLTELVKNHTEFSGDEALYTATIVLVMNKAKYESMPADLRAILDAEAGKKLSEFAAQVMWDWDAPAREIAVKAGNNIITLDEAEVARWKAASAPVVDRWVALMAEKGVDGQATIAKARALIAKNAQ